MSTTFHLVVMGVSGIGKSTVAHRIADTLGPGLAIAEGDDFHSPGNIAKMASGRPLTDEDRYPWLEALAAWTRDRRAGGESTVLTCSALRRAYRDVLSNGIPETAFVHLSGDAELSRGRMAGREHFMPVQLLTSQLETLEPLEDDEPGIVVDAALSTDEIARLVSKFLDVGGPNPHHP